MTVTLFKQILHYFNKFTKKKFLFFFFFFFLLLPHHFCLPRTTPIARADARLCGTDRNRISRSAFLGEVAVFADDTNRSLSSSSSRSDSSSSSPPAPSSSSFPSLVSPRLDLISAEAISDLAVMKPTPAPGPFSNPLLPEQLFSSSDPTLRLRPWILWLRRRASPDVWSFLASLGLDATVAFGIVPIAGLIVSAAAALWPPWIRTEKRKES